MLRSPAPWIGIALWAGVNTLTLTQRRVVAELAVRGAHDVRDVPAASACRWQPRTPSAASAPTSPRRRRWLPRSGAAAGCSAGSPWWRSSRSSSPSGALWLRLRGGLALGAEPGRTLHAHYTLPELLQPVLLAAARRRRRCGGGPPRAAPARGIHHAVRRVVHRRSRVLGHQRARAAVVAPLQVQPLHVEVGSGVHRPLDAAGRLAARGPGAVPGLLGAARRRAPELAALARPLPRGPHPAGRGSRPARSVPGAASRSSVRVVAVVAVLLQASVTP